MVIEKIASYQIEKQFPSFFREDGKELVELIKYYYMFLEEDSKQSVYNNRRIFEYRDVDSTLESMVLFFKNKYMKDLPLDDLNTRFIVKRILDLYRRKGSNEGIELFFRMFFDSEVEIFYPSRDMFKPSESNWKTGSFLQLYPVVSTQIFADIINKKIVGSETGATAFVDNIFFTNLNQSIIPLVFLSAVRGQFSRYEMINSINPNIEYGRIYGSMRSVNIPPIGKLRGDNLVGDIVSITSAGGYGGKGRVTKVSENLSGEIEYTINDGGYGYTITDEAANTVGNTDVIVSEQSLFIENNGIEFILEERIKQVKQVGPSTIEVFGYIVGQNRISIGVSLDKTAPDANSLNYFFEGPTPGLTIQPIQTVDREEANITKPVLFASIFNNSSVAKIGSIADAEEITIITDIIKDVVGVSLFSGNFSASPPALSPLSGTRVNGVIPTLNTALKDAFVPEKFTIGRLSSLTDVDPGREYKNDVYVLARENLLSKFRYSNQILKIQSVQGVIISEGDKIVQPRNIKDFYGNSYQTIVKGDVVKVVGNDVYVKQKTFEPFAITKTITTVTPNVKINLAYKENSTIPITIISRSRDRKSRPLGLNAAIEGIASFTRGKIDELEIIDSGFGYEDGGPIQIFNETKIKRIQDELDAELAKTTPNVEIIDSLELSLTLPEAEGISITKRQGITEGRWISFESHTNQEKVIQDSDFYQDYSYQLSVDVEPNKYEAIYRNIMHPAGTKLFTTFAQTTFINIDIDFVTSEIISTTLSDTGIITEDNNEFLVTEDSGSLYLITKVF